METKSIASDALIQTLVQDYAEKLFYFCLKKTGDSHEAEDLASDILLQCITALRRGTVPSHFPGWVWKIARNRYSVWADRKHKRLTHMAEPPEEDDLSQKIPGDGMDDPGEALVRREELALLRRELSFLRRDYREILLAYYFERKKLCDIALSLDLPKNTVTSKLHRARQKLKEGMHMAREFGKRSYNPEQINFIASGYQPSGLPWRAIRRKIPVNILCEAHNSPSTAEELALELGVALPYMEEEIKLLRDADLLKEVHGGKYLTGFFISPVECQNEMNALFCDFAQAHAGDYWQIAGHAAAEAKKRGARFGGYSDGDVQMYYAFELDKSTSTSCLSDNAFGRFTRPDGGNWGVMGFEDGSVCRLPKSAFSNNSCGADAFGNWNGYQIVHRSDPVFSRTRYREDCPGQPLLPLLQKIAVGRSPLSDTEQAHLRSLVEDGFCILREDGNPEVNAIVTEPSMRLRWKDLETLPGYAALFGEVKALTDACRKILSGYAIPYLQPDFDYYLAMSIGMRQILARMWKDAGMYKGDYGQFCEFQLP